MEPELLRIECLKLAHKFSKKWQMEDSDDHTEFVLELADEFVEHVRKKSELSASPVIPVTTDHLLK